MADSSFILGDLTEHGGVVLYEGEVWSACGRKVDECYRWLFPHGRRVCTACESIVEFHKQNGTPWYWQACTARAVNAGINPDKWSEFGVELAHLEDHNEKHHLHSLRVGMYAHDVAKHLEWPDLKFPLFGGCGHDIGKCAISNDVLDADPFGPEEREAMKAHPQAGYEHLVEHFPYTALIAGLHHTFQDGGYGLEIEAEALLPWDLDARAKINIVSTARLVAICDFFDAVTTRNGPHQDNPEPILRETFSHWPQAIDYLLANRIR